MVGTRFNGNNLTFEFCDAFVKQFQKPFANRADQHLSAILRTENDVVIYKEYPPVVVSVFACHDTYLDPKEAEKLHIYSQNLHGGQPFLRSAKAEGFQGRGLR